MGGMPISCEMNGVNILSAYEHGDRHGTSTNPDSSQGPPPSAALLLGAMLTPLAAQGEKVNPKFSERNLAFIARGKSFGIKVAARKPGMPTASAVTSTGSKL